MITSYHNHEVPADTRGRFSQLRSLWQEGHRIMQRRGFEGEFLIQVTRLYTSTFSRYYTQCDGHHFNRDLELELINRIIAEIKTSAAKDKIADQKQKRAYLEVVDEQLIILES